MANDISGLVESMRENGWTGGPAIVDGGIDDILDGNHRYMAAKALGWSDGDIPVADIRELFGAARMDYDATIDAQCPDRSDHNALAAAQMDAIMQLPSEIMDEYEMFDGNF